jgi:DNA-binding NtrC family response regulator
MDQVTFEELSGDSILPMLFSREDLLQRMKGMNDKLERTSALMKAERCAVVWTDQNPLADEVKDALSGTGLTFYRTREKDETLRAVQLPSVQVLVVDLRLPGVLDVVVTVAKTRGDLSAVPVVGVGPDQGELAQRAGAVAAIPMPLDVVTLRSLLHALLKPQHS